MTRYGTLRFWSTVLLVLGVMSIVSAGVGVVAWAFEVEGTWQTLAVLLFGLPVAVMLATWPIAVAQLMRAVADMGDALAVPPRFEAEPRLPA